MRRSLFLTVALACAFVRLAPAFATEPKIEFNRDIRPILSDACFHCHGPDSAKRQAGLRLDQEEAAKAERDGHRAIFAGEAARSEMVRRITSANPDEVMPPRNSNRSLTAAQIDLLKKWIDQGAQWQSHWSFIAPRRPSVPEIANLGEPGGVSPRIGTTKSPGAGAARLANVIDAFVLQRLAQEGLALANEAEKTTLVRRVTLDLTGAPPTLAEVDEFLADSTPDAFEQLVDRLLASPRYGERMVLDWLDAARYADTNGYQGDGTRTMWPWRDWAIRAINSNMPFDQFTVEQLAGDLLPNATLDQKIATGFHRNHPLNGEGGRIAEESRVEYVMDRVETTGTVWLGLTIGCCRCHDHKYDPLAQKEYYQLYAYFNSIAESGAVDRGGNANPVERLATPETERRVNELREEVALAEQTQQTGLAAVDAAQAEWEQNPSGMTSWTVLDPLAIKSKNGATLTKQPDQSVLASGESPAKDDYEVMFRINAGQVDKPTLVTGLRLEVMADESLPSKGPGRAPENGNFVLTTLELEASAASDPSKPNSKKTVKIPFNRADADYSQGGFNPAGVIDTDKNTGWAVAGGDNGKSRVAIFVCTNPLALTGQTELKVTLKHESVHLQHNLGRFRISLTTNGAPRLDAPPAEVVAALSVAADKRTDAQQTQLRDYYRTKVSPQFASLKSAVDAAKKKVTDYENSLPVTMVMQDQPKPRESFVLTRGSYTQPGDKVSHGVPAALPPLAADAPPNRLALAKWLVDPTNPLTARVTVNRAWQSFFATGLVKTTEDFGTQGQPPSHPELLDWLAVEFGRGVVSVPISVFSEDKNNPDNSTLTEHRTLKTEHSRPLWDVKHLHRLIVTSATYRQSSRVTNDLRERDPENRLLARGPRHRMSAFAIRDMALAMSGLLVERIGGPSVKPYQPAGIWEDASLGKIGYAPDKGEGLYRRSLYTFWRRIAAPTMFFDASNRNVCTVKLLRTNTPLQALALMNDITYVEAARKLAERTLLEGGETPDARLTFAFRIATSRPPTPDERTLLTQALLQMQAHYNQDSAAANKLIATGDSPRDLRLNPTDLAAHTALMNLILNLDETMTKE